MPDCLTFDVPGKPLSVNQIGENKYAKRAEIKYWRDTTGWVLKGRPKTRFDDLVDLEFRVVGPTRYIDHISAVFAVKGITDGIVDAVVIKDDSPKYVNRLIHNRPDKAPKPAVQVVVSGAA